MNTRMTRQIMAAVRRLVMGAGLLLLAQMGAGAWQTGSGSALREADKQYAQQSYKRALQAYTTLQNLGQIPDARRDEIAYRVVVSLGKTEQWDKMFAAGLEFVKARQHTVWEARGLYWLGRMYLAAPHNGYRVGKTIHRGSDVPANPGSEKPVAVQLETADRRNTLDALEAAHVRYGKADPNNANRLTLNERIQLDFDLVHVLQLTPGYAEWAQKQNWLPPTDANWRIEAKQPYDLAWPQPKKTLYLFAHVEKLAGSSPHPHVLALFARGLWLRRYQAEMTRYATQVERGKLIRLPYPYQNEKPENALKEIVRRYPGELAREEAQYLQAVWLVQDGKPEAGVAAFQQFIAACPHSQWVSDARGQLAALRRASVSLEAVGTLRPNFPVKLQVDYSNAKRIRFEAYRVDLTRLALRTPHAKQKDTGDEDRWMQISPLMGNKRELTRAMQTLGASRVASWEVMPKDTIPMRNHAQTITAPLRQAGAYVVVATVSGYRAGILLTVSDLALVQKMDRNRAVYYAANTLSGKPLGGVPIFTKQWWWNKGVYESAIVRGITDANGLASVPLHAHPAQSQVHVAALAVQNNQYAHTPLTYAGEGLAGDRARYQGYTVTDRTVYRPAQTVRFRELLMARENATGREIGDLKPLAGATVRVQVTDPQGNQIYKQRSRCSEWGSLSGEFSLPVHAALGEYAVQVTLIQKEKGKRRKEKVSEEEEIGIETAGSRFRVEEYKKPEFEVTVTPSSERVKLGQATSAKIHAAYYFGGPVPGAKVTYRVYRNLYAPAFRFPQPYDYLYHANNDAGSYDTSYRAGDVVAQGNAKLDAQGDANITFETKADGSRWKDTDLSYTVEADVQDSSRRTISGTGALKATRHDVAVFLNFAHGYATRGDRVDVEVKTLNPSDQPVAVRGTVRVFRKPNHPKEKETPVTSFPLNTDAQGRAMIQWTANTSGYFRIAYETPDSDDKPVSNSVDVWVDGPELRAQRFLFQGVFLAVKNPYYAAGETARILLVTPAPNCAVLLTREVEGQILEKRVVRVPGRSLELNVPIARRDAPNVFLSAVMVRSGAMFTATQELFVPPVQQTALVTVNADKARYQPGETAKLSVQARDWRGRPLRGEFSLAITDAALGYIQKDYAPDIRTSFYGDRRSQSLNTEGSFDQRLETFGDYTQPLKEYAQHPMPFPAGMGQIPMFGASFAGMFGSRTGHERFRAKAVDYAGGANDLYVMDSSNVIDIGRNRPMSARAMSYAAPGGIGGGGAGGSIGHGGPQGPQGETAGVSSRFQQDYDDRGANVEKNGSDPFDVTWHKVPEHAKGLATRRWVWPTSGELANVSIRQNFQDVAFWKPNVVTNTSGEATVTLRWPDNLTQWRALAVGSTRTAQVGTGETRVTTKKDLLVQLESPRFLVERDIATLSAVVHNDTDQDARIRVRLDLDNADVVAEDNASGFGVGDSVFGQSETRLASNNQTANHQPPATNHQRLKTSDTWIMVPSRGQQRVDWLVRPKTEGVMHARMAAQSATDGDATETVIPVLVHGVERQTEQSGVLKGGQAAEANVTIALPEARKAGTSQVVVTLNPSLAGVMLDALPYLADYPYGCVEQTLSRFLPSVIVARTLQDTGYNLSDLEKSALARRKALASAQNGKPANEENSPYTYPSANPNAYLNKNGNPNLNATPYAYYAAPRLNNPVFHSAELARMVKEGLARLRDFQHADGGWGWWKEDGSDPYMTAYVLYGLLTGQKAGYVVPGGELQKGLNYLQKRFLEETDLNQMAYQARVLALVPNMRARLKNRVEGKLFPQREKLSAYSKGLLALALHDLGQDANAQIVLHNLENTARIDTQNGTANWDDVDGQWWRWYNNKVETNATILQAYMAIAPNAALPPMLVKWLVNHRKGSIWHDTRDTALAVNALADWMRVTKELAPDYTLTVNLAGKIQRTYHVNHANALFFENTFIVPDNLLQTGDQTLTITRQGTGTCYYTATTRAFSQEEPIPAAGNELQVTRRYFRLLPGTAKGTEEETRRQEDKRYEIRDMSGGATLNSQLSTLNSFLSGQYELLDRGIVDVAEEGTEQGPVYGRVELQPGELVNSGDLLEVELGLEAKNDYDYVLVEDIKPAGCEPVDVRSGEKAGQGLYANMELRDQKVAFFVSQLPQGRRVLTYRLRAETPGAFHVLPVNTYAMYAPDVRAISSEARIAVQDEETNSEQR